MTSIARDVLLPHLIPELANMVLEYCWIEMGSLCLHIALYFGNYEEVIAQNYVPWDEALSFSCNGGYRKIIDEILKSNHERKGCNLNMGLLGACEAGYTDIVNLLIDLSVDTETWGTTLWNSGLRGACDGRHMDLVQLMIEKGATACCEKKNCLYIQALKN